MVYLPRLNLSPHSLFRSLFVLAPKPHHMFHCWLVNFVSHTCTDWVWCLVCVFPSVRPIQCVTVLYHFVQLVIVVTRDQLDEIMFSSFSTCSRDITKNLVIIVGGVGDHIYTHKPSPLFKKILFIVKLANEFAILQDVL